MGAQIEAKGAEIKPRRQGRAPASTKGCQRPVMGWPFDMVLEPGGLRAEEKVHRATSRVWTAFLTAFVVTIVVAAAAG